MAAVPAACRGSVKQALLNYVSKIEAEDGAGGSGSDSPNWDPKLLRMLRQNGLDEEAAQAVLSAAQGDWDGVLQLLPEVTKVGCIMLHTSARQGAALLKPTQVPSAPCKRSSLSLEPEVQPGVVRVFETCHALWPPSLEAWTEP